MRSTGYVTSCIQLDPRAIHAADTHSPTAALLVKTVLRYEAHVCWAQNEACVSVLFSITAEEEALSPPPLFAPILVGSHWPCEVKTPNLAMAHMLERFEILLGRKTFSKPLVIDALQLPPTILCMTPH
jgi:hypothetical protein